MEEPKRRPHDHIFWLVRKRFDEIAKGKGRKMTKRLFVSDFDGTITKKDFFLLFIDRHLGERGRRYLSDYRAENNPSYQFLNNVFSLAEITWEEYRELVAEISWDPDFPAFLELLRERKTEHLVLSAGADFYIKDAFALKHLVPQRIIANSGGFSNGHLRLTHDTASPVFSEQYGIDKGKAIRLLRKEYDFIYFAGDSLPDISAAEEADIVFAKSSLWRYYQDRADERVIPFENYAQIIEILKQKEFRC